MRRYGWIAIIVLFGLLPMNGSSSSFGQQRSSLGLELSDPTGAPVPGAQVTVSQSGRRVVQAQSNASGLVTFSGTPGEYEVVAASSGFSTARSTVSFRADETAHLRLNIAPSGNPLVMSPPPPEVLTEVRSESQVAQPQQPTLWGRVVALNGEAFPVTDVTVRRGDQTISKTQLLLDGTFNFIADPGRYCVSVANPGYADFAPICTDFTPSEFAQVKVQEVIIDAVHVESPSSPLNPVAIYVGNLPEAAVPPIPAVDTATSAHWNFGALIQSGFGVTEERGDFKFLLIGGHAGRILTPNLGGGLLRGNFEYGVEVFPLWQSYTPKFQRANCVQISPPTSTGGGPTGTYVDCSAEFTVGGTFTGVSVTPAIFRWNFTHGERWMPWIQGAGGLVWTNHKYPAFGVPLPAPGPITIGPPLGDYYLANDGPSANTSVWNFTPQFGVGTHYFVRPRRSIDVSANAVHISSASLGDKNPGVNASVQFSVGYSWWK